jgi:hypothetical protein
MVFSITSSSTASEETFSNAGDIITDTRNQLLPEHSEDLLMVSQNRRLGLQLKFAYIIVFYFDIRQSKKLKSQQYYFYLLLFLCF